jgi:aspartokinase
LLELARRHAAALLGKHWPAVKRVARRMFGALAERGINIGKINTSEVASSVVGDRGRGHEALACLKAAFKVP